MTYKDQMNDIKQGRLEIMKLRHELQALQAQVTPEPVQDYTFQSSSGPVTLRTLFGDKDTLFVVHNMGRGCAYCTQWADGFNGVIDHLQDRAAFVVSSPDAPNVQDEFAASRNWRFRMVSLQGSSFARDMGYIREYDGREGYFPGVSVFRKSGEGIERVSDSEFGPGDDFNPALNLFDLIPEGANGWEPRLSYD